MAFSPTGQRGRVAMVAAVVSHDQALETVRPSLDGGRSLSTRAPGYGRIVAAMAAESETLAPMLAERERVLRVLHREASRLRARGITRLSLFGSMARGEAGPESDVDLLIETDPGAGLGFFEIYDLQEELGTLLGRRVQFAFGSAMRPWLQDWIEKDRIGIY